MGGMESHPLAEEKVLDEMAVMEEEGATGEEEGATGEEEGGTGGGGGATEGPGGPGLHSWCPHGGTSSGGCTAGGASVPVPVALRSLLQLKMRVVAHPIQHHSHVPQRLQGPTPGCNDTYDMFMGLGASPKQNTQQPSKPPKKHHSSP